MNIKISFFDKNNNEIFNSDGSETSFITRLDSYRSAAKNVDELSWAAIDACLDNGHSWQGKYIMGSSIGIEQV